MEWPLIDSCLYPASAIITSLVCRKVFSSGTCTLASPCELEIYPSFETPHSFKIPVQRTLLSVRILKSHLWYRYGDSENPNVMYKHWISKLALCGSRKCPYPRPHGRHLKFLGDGGSERPNIVKKFVEFIWHFQCGGRVKWKIPSVGGYGFLLEPQIYHL